MKKISFLIILFFVPVLFSIANSPDLPVKYWYTGEVFLYSGEKIKGKISYEIDRELLLIFNKGQVKTYASHQIDKFSIIDAQTGSERFFYSIPLRFNGSVRRNYFFEIITEGEMVLLRRQKSRPDGFGLFIFDETQSPYYVNCFDYYFLFRGNLMKVRKFKRDVLDKMTDHDEKVKLFIQKNGLQINKFNDQVMLVRFYNSLCEQDAASIF